MTLIQLIAIKHFNRLTALIFFQFYFYSKPTIPSQCFLNDQYNSVPNQFQSKNNTWISSRYNSTEEKAVSEKEIASKLTDGLHKHHTAVHHQPGQGTLDNTKMIYIIVSFLGHTLV